jgi:hypothetical protein
MDVIALRDRIQSTLDANADIRRQAELDLKHVCVGSTGGVLYTVGLTRGSYI